MKSKASIIVSSSEMTADAIEAFIARKLNKVVGDSKSDEAGLHVYTIDSGCKEEERLEKHIEDILKKFQAVRRTLEELPPNCKVSFYCAHASDDYSGWTLGPDVLDQMLRTRCEWTFGLYPKQGGNRGSVLEARQQPNAGSFEATDSVKPGAS